MQHLLPISVAIVHACESIRFGWRMALEQAKLANVVLELADPASLAAAWPEAGVQVLLLHLGAAVSWLDALNWVRNVAPGTAVLVTGDLTPHLARQAVEAQASGLLHTNAPMAEYLKSISVLAQGGMYFNKDLREELLLQKKRGAAPEAEVVLSNRLRDVLRLASRVEGMSRKRIAESLGLSVRTVDGYMEDLFEIYNVKTRQALVMKAAKRGGSA